MKTGIKIGIWSQEQILMEGAKIGAQLVGIGIFNSEREFQITSIRGSIISRTQSESSGDVDLGKHHALHYYRRIGLK